MQLFLSDLHLPTEPSPLREGFLRFLAGPSPQAQAVYILGDLFEVWIGDDVGLRKYADEAAALRALAAAGTRVMYLHGNRDFMVGSGFLKHTGVQLLPDPSVVQVDGQATLLSHGDLYCTDDVDYQKWRRISRRPWLQTLARHLPENLRERIAGGIRSHSAGQKQMKAAEIMDVNPQAIHTAFIEAGVSRMIHGHTHRPARHLIEIGGRPCERIVLADWQPERMEYLEAGPAGLVRRTV